MSRWRASTSAIWDAIGKALEMPLSGLWGGYRQTIPVNIIGGYYGGDLGRVRAEVAEWIAMGFRGCKFKVGGATPELDAQRVAAAREAAGEDFVITIDANQGYTLQSALELCSMVRDLDIRWFEEPCIWMNYARDMREVRSRGGIPGVRRAERALARRLSRSYAGRSDRRMQR